MSDKRPPYHRRTTKPLPRAELAPVSTPSIEVSKEEETQVECPHCHAFVCPCCHGQLVVSTATAAEWREKYASDPPESSS